MVSAALLTSNDETWTTPRPVFNELDDEFGFSLDAAALAASTLVPLNWYGPDHPVPERRDALTRQWHLDAGDGAVWLNPPYGRKIAPFMAKADISSSLGVTVVALVPARTDTAWFQDRCLHHEIRFLRGRLRFGEATNSAPFPSVVVVMRPPAESSTLPPW